MSDRRTLEIRESHITDGVICATVSLDDEYIGNLTLTLSQWDQLRGTYNLTVLNLSQQSDAETEES